MALLTLLSYAAAAICFVFVTLSLASGLLYLAEVIEEQSRAAKVFGTRAIYAIIGLHVLLWAVNSLPLPLVAFSIACHGVYLQNLGPLWPFISLTSPSFVASCVLVVADHFLWFHHFAGAMQDARRRDAETYHRPHLLVARAAEGPTFMEVAAFTCVCVWLSLFCLFLSLSINDNALPPCLRRFASPHAVSRPRPQRSKPSRSRCSRDLRLGARPFSEILPPHSNIELKSSRASVVKAIFFYAALDPAPPPLCPAQERRS